VFSLAPTLSHTLKSPGVWSFFVLLVIIFVFVKAPDAIQSAADIKQNGLGYTSRQWKNSESMAFVKSVAQEMNIYTNGADVVWFTTGKQTRSLPQKVFAITTRINPQYHGEIERMCKDIKENRAILVYFDLIGTRTYLSSH
jgi:hypothetical protein